MDHWSELENVVTDDGDVMTLRESGGEFEMRFNGWELMSSRSSLSEETLARVACEHLAQNAPRILIGGLGMGYTLRAALDSLGPDARIVVSELFPEVVDWNRGTLASLTSRPLDDDRVSVCIGSVVDVLATHRLSFDAILLDVDNGPEALLYEPNRVLYSVAGMELIRSALVPDGILGVWSADHSPGFEAVLDAAGMTWRRVDVTCGTPTRVPGRGGGRGEAAGQVTVCQDSKNPEHTIYLARTVPHPPCARP
jgi:spermidine synthase